MTRTKKTNKGTRASRKKRKRAVRSYRSSSEDDFEIADNPLTVRAYDLSFMRRI